jgi:hypothetical protein
MNRALKLMVALTMVVGAARPTSAQWNVARFGTTNPNQMYVTFGVDPAVVTSVGYARDVRIAGLPWQLGVEAGAVAADFDVQDFRARLVARSALLRWRSVRVIGSAAFITRGTENTIYRALNFGGDFTGTLGCTSSAGSCGELATTKRTPISRTAIGTASTTILTQRCWYLNTDGTFHTA